MAERISSRLRPVPVAGPSWVSRVLGRSYLAFVIVSGVALAVYMFFVVMVAMSDMDSHNRSLNMFEEQFGRLEHPSSTTAVSQQSKLGSLESWEVQCDYFIGELRQFSGSKKDVVSAYAHSGRIRDAQVNVAFLAGDKFVPAKSLDALPEELEKISDWEVPAGADPGSLYLVYIYSIGNKAGLDLRCGDASIS